MASISIDQRLTVAAILIDRGREWLAQSGKRELGGIFFDKGVQTSRQAFMDAYTTNDKSVIVKAEFVFAVQDYSLRNKDNVQAAAFLRKGVQDMEDVLLFLSASPDALKGTNVTISSKDADRINGYPYDAFHKCLASQVTRLKNSLGSNMPSPVETELVNRRMENLKYARELHLKDQSTIIPKRKRGKELGD